MLTAVTIVGFGVMIFQLAALRILLVDIVKQLRMVNIRAEGEDRSYLSAEELAEISIKRDAGLY